MRAYQAARFPPTSHHVMPPVPATNLIGRLRKSMGLKSKPLADMSDMTCNGRVRSPLTVSVSAPVANILRLWTVCPLPEPAPRLPAEQCIINNAVPVVENTVESAIDSEAQDGTIVVEPLWANATVAAAAPTPVSAINPTSIPCQSSAKSGFQTHHEAFEPSRRDDDSSAKVTKSKSGLPRPTFHNSLKTLSLAAASTDLKAFSISSSNEEPQGLPARDFHSIVADVQETNTFMNGLFRDNLPDEIKQEQRSRHEKALDSFVRDEVINSKDSDSSLVLLAHIENAPIIPTLKSKDNLDSACFSKLNGEECNHQMFQKSPRTLKRENAARKRAQFLAGQRSDEHVSKYLDDSSGWQRLARQTSVANLGPKIQEQVVINEAQVLVQECGDFEAIDRHHVNKDIIVIQPDIIASPSLPFDLEMISSFSEVQDKLSDETVPLVSKPTCKKSTVSRTFAASSRHVQRIRAAAKEHILRKELRGSFGAKKF